MSTRHQKIEHLANNLPDDLFADHEDMKPLQAEEGQAVERVLAEQKKLPTVDRAAAEALVTRLKGEVSAAQHRKATAAVGDLIAGDLEFSKTLRVMEYHERAKRQLDAVQTALATVDACLSDMAAAVQEANSALNKVRSRRAEVLRRLKLEHAEGIISGRIPGEV